MAFPKNFTQVEAEVSRIRAHFGKRLEGRCIVVGNGPSAACPRSSPEEIDEAVVFRANWFFLEAAKHYGRRVDGFFWSVDNIGLRAELEKRVLSKEYELDAVFQPFIASDSPERVDDTTAKTLAPTFDHWAVIATEPTLARFLMGRPLPTQGMQMIAFAAALGFRRIEVSGVDLYESTAQRYAWEVPAAVKAHLEVKDFAVGYEQRHSLDRDLMFLRAVRNCFDVELTGISEMRRIAPLLDRMKPAPVGIPVQPPALSAPSLLPERIFVTLADGEYAVGACALARSLARVTAVPLVVLHTDPKTPEILAGLENVICRAVAGIVNPHHHGQARFAATYTKLRIFELTECKRVIYIDADCMVRASIDDLFERDDFCAAPDWGRVLTGDFNSGLLAFSPTPEMLDRVMSSLHELESNDGGDQGFLNSLLRDEVTMLPPEYNTLKHLPVYHPDLVNVNESKVIHFVGAKPWHLRASEGLYLALEHEWANLLQLEDWRRFYAVQRAAATAPVNTSGLLRSSRALLRFARGLDRRLPASLSSGSKRLMRKVKLI